MFLLLLCLEYTKHALHIDGVAVLAVAITLLHTFN